MEEELHKPRQENLMTELAQWQRVEEGLKTQTYIKDFLKDKDYLKLKLSRYDEIYQKYKNDKPYSKDEEVHMAILQFQRKKMRRFLYPGLLTRIFKRLQMAIKTAIADYREARSVKNDTLEKYAFNSIDLPATEKTIDLEKRQQESNLNSENIVRDRQTQDLGRRRPPNVYGKGQRKH